MGEPMTKERLFRYRYLAMENKSLLEQIAQKESEAMFPATKESDGSQHTNGPGDRMERAVIRKMEYEDRFRPTIEANKQEMEAVERAICSLTDPMERDVLRQRYIYGDGYQHRGWKDVAKSMYRDDDEAKVRMAHRVHVAALLNIEKVDT